MESRRPFNCRCYTAVFCYLLLFNFDFSPLHSPAGDQEISPLHPQMNSTEPDNPRTWSATSVVQVSAMRERHGDMLRCVAHHESYQAKSVMVDARLDVKCECCCANDSLGSDTAASLHPDTDPGA